jgi:hypothetical protein
VLAAGRHTEASMQVTDAAAAAARAASVARTATDATHAAQDAVAAMMSGDPTGCHQPVVSVDTSTFTPGGSVTATVRCTVSFADLTGLGLPGSDTVTATATEVLDQYRSTAAGPPIRQATR